MDTKGGKLRWGGDGFVLNYAARRCTAQNKKKQEMEVVQVK